MNLSYIKNIRNVVASAQGNTTNNSTNFSNHKSLKTKIKQVTTVSLIFLSMVTGEVFAGDKRPKSKANAARKQNVTFEAIHLSSSLLPDIVPTFPLPDLIPSNPPVTPPPPPPLPDIVPPIIFSDVVPQSSQLLLHHLWHLACLIC